MNRGKAVVVAIAVAAPVIAANVAVAAMAAATNSPPEAATFGITGLTAALIALILAILWAWRSEPAQPRAAAIEPIAPAIAPPPAQPSSVAVSGAVIVLADWLKAHSVQLNA
ncbi:MAG TPA: hypothetical protein VGL83_13195 [Stellaceae bacterium]|jgi:hypothetical protein